MNALARLPFLLTIVISLVSISLQGKIQYQEGNKTLNEGKSSQPESSEFRAVWIATINNIDWPSRPNLTVEQQKSEFIKLLDTFSQFKMNVVILQVRAASDAFYQSKTEPWSRFLTGKLGAEPQPYYDPLAWAIEMCHQRGMELHAWFNPFRVRNLGYYPLDPKSFPAKNPQFVKEYDHKLFLDPGYPAVIAHVVKVIAEVAGNYDVDAILLDDYFYPYPVEGKKFRDEKSFAKYGGTYFPGRLKDWRRNNIDHFIANLHDTLQRINPKVKFGISPFGIWRNKATDMNGSLGKKGISSYDDLYADVRKWLQQGWIDYVVPQLYWENGNHFGDFASLLQWWSENNFGKPVYIGQALFKSTAVKNGWIQPDELANQINLLRTNEKVRGFAFYSASNLGKLTKEQVKSLCDNQLKSFALIDDNRRTPSPSAPKINQEISKIPKNVKTDKMLFDEYILSLESSPVSIRPELPPLTGEVLLTKLMDQKRKLHWNAIAENELGLYALISFEETGTRRYRQKIEEISKVAEFDLTAERWKELKKRHLLIVFRDLKDNKEYFTKFFQMKRKSVKFENNPFRRK